MRNVRDFIHRDDDGGQEFVSDGLHVLDGGFQSRPYLLMGHGLLWSHVIRQLTVEDRTERDGEKEQPLISYHILVESFFASLVCSTVATLSSLQFFCNLEKCANTNKDICQWGKQ